MHVFLANTLKVFIGAPTYIFVPYFSPTLFSPPLPFHSGGDWVAAEEINVCCLSLGER
jgi:hypothetical protein